jgi:hypothetical protein
MEVNTMMYSPIMAPSSAQLAAVRSTKAVRSGVRGGGHIVVR